MQGCLLKFNKRILSGLTKDERNGFRDLSTIMPSLLFFVLLSKFKSENVLKELSKWVGVAPQWLAFDLQWLASALQWLAFARQWLVQNPQWLVLIAFAAYQAVIIGLQVILQVVSLCALQFAFVVELTISWKIKVGVFSFFGTLAVCLIQDTNPVAYRMLLGLCLLGLLALMSFDIHQIHMLEGLYFIQGTMYVLLYNYSVNAKIALKKVPEAANHGKIICFVLFSLVQMTNKDSIFAPMNLYIGTTGILVVSAFYAMDPLDTSREETHVDQQLDTSREETHVDQQLDTSREETHVDQQLDTSREETHVDQQLDTSREETKPNCEVNLFDVDDCLCIVAHLCITALDSRYDYLLSSTMRNDLNLNENTETQSDAWLYLLLAFYEYYWSTNNTSPSSLQTTLRNEWLMYCAALQFLEYIGPQEFAGDLKGYCIFGVVTLFRFAEKQTGEFGAEKNLLNHFDEKFSHLVSRIIVSLVTFFGNMVFRLTGLDRSYYCSRVLQVVLLLCICGLAYNNKSKKGE